MFAPRPKLRTKSERHVNMMNMKRMRLMIDSNDSFKAGPLRDDVSEKSFLRNDCILQHDFTCCQGGKLIIERKVETPAALY